MHGLEMPLVLAGLGIDRHDRVGEQVVAGSIAAPVVRRRTGDAACRGCRAPRRPSCTTPTRSRPIGSSIRRPATCRDRSRPAAARCGTPRACAGAHVERARVARTRRAGPRRSSRRGWRRSCRWSARRSTAPRSRRCRRRPNPRDGSPVAASSATSFGPAVQENAGSESCHRRASRRRRARSSGRLDGILWRHTSLPVSASSAST